MASAKEPDMIFANQRELQCFLRVGQHVTYCSPCVNRQILKTNHPMVYEQWQLTSTKKKSKFFQCQRARGCRKGKGKGFVQSPDRKRKRSIRGYVGCECPARMTITCNAAGGFDVTFRGIHNHDVQTDMLNFINPIQVCRTIRDMVDEKLYTGISKAGKIRQTIHEELLHQCQRKDHESCFQFRNFNMAIALETKDIINRKQQLCLEPDALVNKNDALAVEELVKTWQHELGEESPVRYFKQVGLKNADTDDEDPKSDFNSQDFLIVLQSSDQAQMLIENPRILCVDATHGVTGYDYYLLSIAVIDSNGSALLCAWALASRENHLIWEIFARNLWPATKGVHAEVLMSDDANCAYNGLIRVWPSITHKLLCHWHVKNNVRKRCMACEIPTRVSKSWSSLFHAPCLQACDLHASMMRPSCALHAPFMRP